jgi:hypothetical protein
LKAREQKMERWSLRSLRSPFMNRVNRVQCINRARIFKIMIISVIPKTTAIVLAVQVHPINLAKINQ